MNDPNSTPNLDHEEVVTLRQRLRDLEQSHQQCQKQVQQLTQELTQAREAQQQAEAQLQLTLTSANMVGWDMDLNHNYVVCSPNALSVWGLQAGTGDEFFAMVHPDDRQLLIQAIERAIAGEIRYVQEYRVIRPDGQLRWLNSQGQVYLDETGRGTRMIGLSLDITERKQTEIALRQSQEHLKLANERFELAAKAVNGLIYEWHLDQDRIERTDGLTQLLGYTLAEAEPTSQWWRDRIHPDDLKHLDQDRLVLTTKDYFTAEYRILNKANEYIYVLDQCLVVTRNLEGKPTRIVGSTTDISDRKRAEAERQHTQLQLQQSQQFIQQIADAMPGTLYVYDLQEQRNVYINRQIGELLGYTPEQIQTWGEHLFAQLMHSEDFTKVGREIERLHQAQDGEVIDYEYRMRHANGEWRWLWSRNTVSARTPEGRPYQVVGTVHDITARKHAELETQKFASLADNSTEFIGMCDMNFIPFYVNPAGMEMVGLEDVQQYRETPVKEFFFPEDQDFILNEFFPRILHEGRAEVEVRFRHFQTGEAIWMIYNVFYICGENEQPIGLATVSRNITVRKQARADLLLREQEFRTLVENTPDVIIRYDRDLRHLYINPSIERALGIPAAQFIGYTSAELGFTDPATQAWTSTLQQVFATGEPHSIEIEYPSSTGELRSYQARFVPELIEQDQVTTVLAVATDITDYKQAETLLRQNEERLRLALEAAQMGTWDVDLMTGKAIWSERHFTMLGYEATPTGEASEQMWCNQIHPDDLERVLATWQQARLDHKLYRTEYRVIRADTGETAWIAGLGSFTYDETGQAIRSIGVIFDISDRKHTEAALAESNQTLQAIIQACPLAIMGVQADGIVRIWNPAAERIFGWTQAEVYGQFLPTVPEDRWDEFLQNLALTIQGQGLAGIETQRQKRGNVLFDVELWSAPVEQAQAGISCLAVVADISDRKQAEAALQESKEKFQALADNIAQLAWMADDQGWIFWYNQRWFDYTGTTLAEMQGWGWQKVHHPDHVERVTKKFCSHVESGEIWEDTFPIRGKDGQYRWFLSRAIPIRNQQGQTIRWCGTNTDITERQQAEAEREQLLQREKEAREQAEAANRVKDEFLAVLSHELRTPLNPILGWTRLLRSRHFDAAATDRALETIERNTKLQAQLIEDLLDVSRILQGKLNLNVSLLHLPSLIEAALETVRLSAETKGIHIQTKLDAVDQVSGDANRIQQIFWNLLSNAVKFTPAGGQVTVDLRQVDNHAQIQISDTGQGIHPEFLPYVFEYFRQADSSTTRQYGGLGLGLAIVHHLVEMHGGTITAASPGLGMGATFTVQLPSMTAELRAVLASEANVEISNFNDIEILVVDDEADMRELIQFILEAQGAIVRVAASATEALQQLAKAVPNILISDIGMPEMDGYALIQQVRHAKYGQMLPAIALTAYAGDINQHKALAAGFQRHLAKPIEPEQLVETVAQLVARIGKPLS